MHQQNMLTQGDLDQIRGIVKSEIETELKFAIQSELKLQLRPAIQAELKVQLSPAIQSELKIALKDYPTRDEMNKRFDSMAKMMTGKTNLIIGFFDREHMDLEKRVEKVEQFLKLS